VADGLIATAALLERDDLLGQAALLDPELLETGAQRGQVRRVCRVGLRVVEGCGCCFSFRHRHFLSVGFSYAVKVREHDRCGARRARKREQVPHLSREGRATPSRRPRTARFGMLCFIDGPNKK